MTDDPKYPSHRPLIGADFHRAHGLGNDYLVMQGEGAVPEGGLTWRATADAVERVCHRMEGVGSDGIMVVCSDRAPFQLRAFNPDGSEFERSGNGLRIVASWLHRQGLVASDPFETRIAGDTVVMQVHEADPGTGLYDISVEMGRARVGPSAVEFASGESGLIPQDVTFVSVGNPHTVVWDEGIELSDFGHAVATHPGFANGTNVQQARVTDRREAGGELSILIWERGVGPTLASGSSSCACAVAAVQTGRLNPGEIRVRMPGGELIVTVSAELDVLLRGPVQAIGSGQMDSGFVAGLERGLSRG